jgi:hypothetical protein
VHTLSAKAVAADVLDLEYRLPLCWGVFLTGRADAWLVRKIASLTRALSQAAVALVDAAAAEALPGQAPGRVLSIVEARIIEADPEAHAAKVEAEQQRRYVSLTRTDETGLRHMVARVTAGDAAYVDAAIARVADILAGLPEHEGASRDLLRSIAFGWLGRPAEMLTLFLEHMPPEPADADTDETEPEPEPAGEPEPDPTPARALAFPADLLDALRKINPDRLRPKVVLYVHLHEAALAGAGTGVARVEGLGPHGLTQLTELLGHARVVVKPVIDLRKHVSVNCYEHPTRVKERIHLKQPGDAFPHATIISRNLDTDHRIAYRPNGPPDQTGTRNGQPLRRTGHRAKTHLGYRVIPLWPGATLWRTPHGLHRVVDEHGTHRIDQTEADALTGTSPVERALVRLTIRHRTRMF